MTLLTFSAPMWLLWLGIYFSEPFTRRESNSVQGKQRALCSRYCPRPKVALDACCRATLPYATWQVLIQSQSAYFPVTLAYVILGEPAMEVRIVLRQGLQYPSAQRGVVMMQVLLTAPVIYVGATVAIQKPHKTPVIMATVVALGFVTAFVVARGA